MSKATDYLNDAKDYLMAHPKVTAVLVALLVGLVVGAVVFR